MGNSSGGYKYDWDLLLKEYLVTNLTKTEFATSKGINPAYLRRFAGDWPNHKKVTSDTVTKQDRKKPIKKSITMALRETSEKGKKAKGVAKSKEFENPGNLSPREQLFCILYVRNSNAGVSYVKAGYNSKNMAVAASDACQLLLRPQIKAEVDRLRRLQLASFAMTQEDLTSKIVEQRMITAFSDMTHIVDFGTYEIPLRDSEGKVIMLPNKKTGVLEPVYESVNRLMVKDSSQVDGRIITKVSQSERGISVTIEGRDKALDWLAAYFSINPLDKHKIEYDQKRLELEEKALVQKGKTGNLIAEAIAQAPVQVATLAGLINNPQGNRDIKEFEK